MKLPLLFCILAAPTLLFAQVNFNTVSFDQALHQSFTEGKLLFVQFEAADCNQCNDVANKGFENKEVADQINQTFFCLKISDGHPDRGRIASLYNLDAKKGFGTLFIDHKGTLVHKFLKTTSFSKEYSKQVDIALLKAGENLKINELENEYRKGNRSYGFLEILLEKRKTLNLPTDSLLSEYIDAVPPDSIKTIRTLAFIAKMGPLLDSKADKIMRQDYPLFLKAWATIDLATRININNTIISKSMAAAISDKNEKFALRTARFAMATITNQNAGIKAYEMHMMRYYNGIDDTATYYRKAIAYYDRYYLSSNVEEVKKQDSLNLKKMLSTAKKDTVIEGNRMKTTASVTYSPTVRKMSGELNNAAYEFYRRSNDPYLLSIATQWSIKALEFHRSPQALDTYARLLYKQGQIENALAVMSEAISLQQKEGYPTKDFDMTLNKMKNKKPLDP